MRNYQLYGVRATMRLLLRVLLALSVVTDIFLGTAPITVLAQGPCGETETVVACDTLYKIAARCDTTVVALLKLNPQIINRNLIRVGQAINIPSQDNPTPSETTVRIEPERGPPATLLTVTGRNFPAKTEVIVGIGTPESEPFSSLRAMTNASGALNIQVTAPETAQANQRFVVVAYVRGQGGAAATSQEFITTSGQEQNGNVTIIPQQGPANSVVQLQASGFAPTVPVEIGFGLNLIPLNFQVSDAPVRSIPRAPCADQPRQLLKIR